VNRYALGAAAAIGAAIAATHAGVAWALFGLALVCFIG
jgi:hypothetical protein